MLSACEPHTRILPRSDPTLSGPVPAGDRSLRGSRFILGGIALFSLLGVALSFWLRRIPAGNPDPRLAFNVFYYLFARHEPAGLSIVASFAVTAAMLLGWRRDFFSSRFAEFFLKNRRWTCLAVALGVFAVTATGTQIVFHDYALTADENLADFQATILLRGKVQAEVPPQWLPAIRVIKPTFIDYFPDTHSWKATYLPVYAAMRAVFQSVGWQSLFNPFLAAITILALYATVRNIWPETPTNALVAVGLLATSSQFLLMSMTGYAMPAHLALNTIWLWLYSRPDRRTFYLAPVVGALAIGLHQPIVHALFVLPFLARLLWQRRWLPVVVFGASYLFACVGWYIWKMHFIPPAALAEPVKMFRLVNLRMAFVQPMNLLLVIAWASLATPLLAALGFGRFFKARPIVQDAIISCLLTFGFYYFFYLDQAHGWGYRYFHGTLVCLVIVAVTGFRRLGDLAGKPAALIFLLGGMAASVLLQLPLRCFQAEAFVRPYARTAAVIHAFPVDIVALDARDAWYSADLIRNDPFLENRPVIVSVFGLTPAAVDRLAQAGTVHFLTRAELTRLGMFTARPNDYQRDPFMLGRGK
jgi:hypothetical protein